MPAGLELEIARFFLHSRHQSGVCGHSGGQNRQAARTARSVRFTTAVVIAPTAFSTQHAAMARSTTRVVRAPIDRVVHERRAQRALVTRATAVVTQSTRDVLRACGIASARSSQMKRCMPTTKTNSMLTNARYVASLLFIATLSLPSICAAYTLKQTATGNYVRWSKHGVTLRIDPALEQLLDAGQVRSAATMASDAWQIGRAHV